MNIIFQTLLPLRIVEDFRDWTNWLFYRGGIGVKGEESWEAWWEEELVIRI
jgi:callose synthase